MFGKRDTPQNPSRTVRVGETPAGGGASAQAAAPATASGTPPRPGPAPAPARASGTAAPAAPPRPVPPARPAAPQRPSHPPAPRSGTGTGTGAGASSSSSSTSSSSSSAPAARKPARAESRVLHVGKNIRLKGEIAACDQLVVEGEVEAEVANASQLEILREGALSGSAEVDSASVSGKYDGKLRVKGLLVVKSGGTISGEVHCGELEVERGGRINGQISLASNASGAASA